MSTIDNTVFEFDAEKAVEVGNQSSAVTGPQACKIESAKLYTQDGKTIAEFTLAPTNGTKTLRFVKLLLKKADGTDGYGLAMWQQMKALLNLTGDKSVLRIEKLEEDMFGVITEVYYIRAIEGKVLGFLLQRSNYGLSDDKKYYRYSMNVVMVFDSNTKKTWPEKKGNQDAKAVDKRMETLVTKTTPGLETPTFYAGATTPTVDDTPDTDF